MMEGAMAKEMGIDTGGPVAAYSTGRHEVAAQDFSKRRKILVRIHGHPDSVLGGGVERARGSGGLPCREHCCRPCHRVGCGLAEGIEQEDAYARVAGVLPASRQP